MLKINTTNLKEFFLLFIFIGALFFAKLGSYPLNVPDGARYAEIPREMVATGDYITPHLNGIKYFEKPPLFYWLQAASIKIFGVNDFAVSFMSALIALWCCFLVRKLAYKAFNTEGIVANGLFASVILATSMLFFTITRIVTLDMAFTAFLTASLMHFLLGIKEETQKKRNRHMWAVYFFAGLSVMTKGLIGIIFPLAIIFFWVLIFNEWRNLKTYCIFSGLLLLIAVAAPWHILVQLKNPEFFHFYFLDQQFLRYFTPSAHRGQPFWFMPVFFLVMFLPWIFFLPQAIKNIFTKKHEVMYRKCAVFLILWVAVIYIFYSFSDSKLIPYLLPMLPPMAILVGNYFAEHWLLTSNKKSFNCGFIIAAFINIIFGSLIIFIAKYIDFTMQGPKSFDVYVAAGFLLFSGIAVLVSVLFTLNKNNIQNSFIVLLITTAWFLFMTNPIITVISNKSTKPLALMLKEKLQPNDEIIHYETYFQDMPFYLQRTVTIANVDSELNFGIQHQNVDGLVLSKEDFFKHWQESKKKIYMVTELKKYNSIKPDLKNKDFLVAQYLKTVVVSNQ